MWCIVNLFMWLERKPYFINDFHIYVVLEMKGDVFLSLRCWFSQYLNILVELIGKRTVKPDNLKQKIFMYNYQNWFNCQQDKNMWPNVELILAPIVNTVVPRVIDKNKNETNESIFCGYYLCLRTGEWWKEGYGQLCWVNKFMLRTWER